MPEISPDDQQREITRPGAADIVRVYHRRTKHRFERYAAGPETLDWDAQPAAFRHFAGAQRIVLPLADVAGGGPLPEALRRPFADIADLAAPIPLALDSIGSLLHLALGITAWKGYGPDRWAVRANPSSGNLHPVEAYVIACGVPGLADGVHHYEPESHALECRARYHAAGTLAPGLHIALASIMWREAWKYGERAFRYCQLDTGHAMAALRYAAAALGWKLAAQPQVGSTLLGEWLGLDRAQDFPAGRVPETELEEPELLLSVGYDGMVPTGVDAAALCAATATAEWSGIASSIDSRPIYRWPVIGEIARLTRGDSLASGADVPVRGELPRVSPAASAEPSPAVIDVVLGRRSAQHFDPGYSMPKAMFMRLMSRLVPALAAPWDVMPQTWAMDLVVFVHRVEELATGIYLLSRGELRRGLAPLLAARHALAPVAGAPAGVRLQRIAEVEAPALQRLARSLHCHQDIAAHACFALGMLCEFDAAIDASASAYRELFRQAGVLGQVLYLEAEAVGLRGTGIGCYFDDAVHEMLGLDGTAFQSLYHFTVGKARVDARIQTMPAYANRAPEVTGPA